MNIRIINNEFSIDNIKSLHLSYKVNGESFNSTCLAPFKRAKNAQVNFSKFKDHFENYNKELSNDYINLLKNHLNIDFTLDNHILKLKNVTDNIYTSYVLMVLVRMLYSRVYTKYPSCIIEYYKKTGNFELSLYLSAFVYQLNLSYYGIHNLNYNRHNNNSNYKVNVSIIPINEFKKGIININENPGFNGYFNRKNQKQISDYNLYEKFLINCKLQKFSKVIKIYKQLSK